MYGRVIAGVGFVGRRFAVDRTCVDPSHNNSGSSPPPPLYHNLTTPPCRGALQDDPLLRLGLLAGAGARGAHHRPRGCGEGQAAARRLQDHTAPAVPGGPDRGQGDREFHIGFGGIGCRRCSLRPLYVRSPPTPLLYINERTAAAPQGPHAGPEVLRLERQPPQGSSRCVFARLYTRLLACNVNVCTYFLWVGVMCGGWLI